MIHQYNFKSKVFVNTTQVYELNLLLHKNKVQPFHLRAVIRELKIYLFELVYNQRTSKYILVDS